MIELDKRRVFGLDVLRALAIFLVVYGHGSKIIPDDYFGIYHSIVIDGVSIFFVLSGFLIGGILIRDLEEYELNRNFLFNFWTRRWLRTIPVYYFVLCLLLFLRYMNDHSIGLAKAMKFFFFIQNIYSRPPGDFFPEAWSLSIEEWFYLSLPILLFILVKWGKMNFRKAILLAAIVIVLFATAVRLYRYLAVGSIDTGEDHWFWTSYFRKQVVTRLDSLMYGVICAYLMHFSPKLFFSKAKTKLLLGVALLVVMRVLLLAEMMEKVSFFNCVFTFSVESLAVALCLPAMSKLKNVDNAILFKSVTFISLISYSMYLWNLIVYDYIVLPLEGQHWTLRYFLFWCGTILLSMLTYSLIEKPFLFFRDKIKFSLSPKK